MNEPLFQCIGVTFMDTERRLTFCGRNPSSDEVVYHGVDQALQHFNAVAEVSPGEFERINPQKPCMSCVMSLCELLGLDLPENRERPSLQEVNMRRKR